jgi:hypothetical protein
MSDIEETHAPDKMNCTEFVELVTDYLEGRLPAGTAAEFETHMEVCPPCLRYLDQMRTTLEALGTLPEESIPDGAREAILHAFADRHPG